MTSAPGDPTAGDYPDSEGGDVEAGEGTYTDQETPTEKRGEEPDQRGPRDRGEFTDSDHVADRRATPAAGGYTSKDTVKDTSTPGTDRVNDQAEEHPHG